MEKNGKSFGQEIRSVGDRFFSSTDKHFFLFMTDTQTIIEEDEE